MALLKNLFIPAEKLLTLLQKHAPTNHRLQLAVSWAFQEELKKPHDDYSQPAGELIEDARQMKLPLLHVHSGESEDKGTTKEHG